MKKFLLIALAAVAVTVATGYGVIRDLESGTTACGTSATKVTSDDGYSSIFLDNPNSTSVYIGGSNVTTSNGIEIGTAAGTQYMSLDAYQGQIYCIVASATQTIRHMAGK